MAAQTPDILLFGLAFYDGNGMDFRAEVRRSYHGVKIQILTNDDEYSITKRAMDERAAGFIQKNALPEEFTRAIAIVANGKNHIGGKIGMSEEDKQNGIVPEWLKPLERDMVPEAFYRKNDSLLCRKILSLYRQELRKNCFKRCKPYEIESVFHRPPYQTRGQSFG